MSAIKLSIFFHFIFSYLFLLRYNRYKNGSVLNATETVKMERSETGVHMLIFKKPRMADIGTYTCQGVDARSATAEIRVASITPFIFILDP